ncbi:hypothetical protein N9H57_02760 [Flavobacteriaceae bacterium]|nr:hypothetical protein [Flavobacteriaceae bacterium]MDB3863041.1 hypothetical protein [Flavobacteriaceae bacterium]MDC3354131.1 hypothetical protein [Flavobacteriaceae bacterium]
MLESVNPSLNPEYFSVDIIAKYIPIRTSSIQSNMLHLIASKEQGVILKRID